MPPWPSARDPRVQRSPTRVSLFSNIQRAILRTMKILFEPLLAGRTRGASGCSRPPPVVSPVEIRSLVLALCVRFSLDVVAARPIDPFGALGAGRNFCAPAFRATADPVRMSVRRRVWGKGADPASPSREWWDPCAARRSRVPALGALRPLVRPKASSQRATRACRKAARD